MDTETPAAEEGAAAADETDEAQAEEGAPAAETPEGAEAPPEGAQPTEGEEKPETDAAAKPVEISEDVLRAAAIKFANKTMAAARRAEKAATTVATENATLKGKLQVHEAFVTSWRSDPLTAVRQLASAGIGDGTVKGLIQHILDSGAVEEKPQTTETRLERLEREFRERGEGAAKEQAVAQRTADEKAVAEAIGKQVGTRYGHAATRTGQARLWEAIDAYAKLHGNVPDEAVYRMADEVEKEMAEEFGPSTKVTVPRRDATKHGATAAAGAAPAARTSGKTLTNGATGGAPSKRTYSDDPDERRKQVNADMRAAGEL